MKIPCIRCKKNIDKPNKNNAKYILEIILNNNKELIKKTSIICLECLKEIDEIIW